MTGFVETGHDMFVVMWIQSCLQLPGAFEPPNAGFCLIEWFGNHVHLVSLSCRAASHNHGSLSLHTALRHLTKELSRSQAEHDKHCPASLHPLADSATAVSAARSVPNAATQSSADLAAVVMSLAGGGDEDTEDTDESAETRWVPLGTSLASAHSYTTRDCTRAA